MTVRDHTDTPVAVRWVDRPNAARLVCRPVETLRWWAQTGGPDHDPFPRPVRTGRRSHYVLAEVEDWMTRQEDRR